MILFDLDGTLTESGIGITRSAAYSFQKMGLPVPDQAVLDRFVGPPLVAAFMEYGSMNEEDAQRATAIYRERYGTVGWAENRVYTGIAPLLKALRREGAYLAIASGKPQIFVERIIKHFHLDKYFDKLVGITLETTNTDKKALMLDALPEKYDPARVAVVGDRCFDIDAAKALGFHGVGVLYGYGTRDELKASGADALAADVDALSELLLGGAPREGGRFITFEGADGCGKSTQLGKCAERLKECGWDVVVSREPGGCPISEAIRGVVLDIANRGMSDECEALLFAASRAQHVRDVILPALAAGKIMLCDRFLDSSFAYQARGRELGDEFIRQINKYAMAAVPDRTLLFTGLRETVSRRLRAQGNADRIEIEQDAFVKRVYDGFEAVRSADPARVHEIDSNRGIEEIFTDTEREVFELLAE